MANYSIPNSTPVIGRISTSLSRRSRKQNNLFAIRSSRSAIRNPESEGCLVVLAVFKTVVGSAYRDRGRFDSYPLRFNFSRHPERSEAKSKDPVAVSQGNSSGFLDFARNDEHHKGGD